MMLTSYVNVAMKMGTIQLTQDDVQTIIFGLKLGIPEGSYTTRLLQDFETLDVLLEGSPK
ncbi:MAG TPA: hypothetical protein VIY48_19215 [Candidatus Paceibacterota bacterium]